MKNVFIVYNTSCLYKIVILSYFMSFTNYDVVMCSLNGKPIRAMEGYSVNVDMSLSDVDKAQIRSFIVPGGNISYINNEEMRTYLQELKENNILIAGICAGVDLLDEAGILKRLKSTHSTDDDKVLMNQMQQMKLEKKLLNIQGVFNILCVSRLIVYKIRAA